MTLPGVPTVYGLVVFVVLLLLLYQKEVMRALGQAGTRRWRRASNSLIGLLFVLYALILLSRFLELL